MLFCEEPETEITFFNSYLFPFWPPTLPPLPTHTQKGKFNSRSFSSWTRKSEQLEMSVYSYFKGGTY